MILDIKMVSPWHLSALLGMFIAMYSAAGFLVGRKVVAWRVHSTGRPIYYAGWILALLITAAASIAIRNVELVWGLAGSAIMIILIGRLDEDKSIPVPRQLFWQALIALWAVYFGWTIPYVSNPFGEGVIMIAYGGFAAFLWLVLCMNAMNFLDGTDGLASAVGVIAFASLAGISLLPATQDPLTLILSLVALGALTAFFLWNVPPARVYLGTSGSWFLGMFLGMTAMIGGGKIATALIVLALPVLDALFVIFYRVMKKRYPWKGDTTSHIHHRLRAWGISPWGILLFLGFITALLGVVAVIAPTHIKLAALVLFAGIFFVSRAMSMRA